MSNQQALLMQAAAGGGSSDFVTDTFTEAADRELSLHTGEVGATWTKHPDSSYSAAFMNVESGTDRIYPDTTTAYYASGNPPSADYYVQADFFVQSVISVNNGICLRMDTSANTMYSARLNNGTTWELRKIVAGAASTLGTSTNQIPGVGASKTVKLIASGTSLTVQVNGVTEIGPITDSAISAAGKAGVRGSGVMTASTGYHLDNFSAR